MNLNPKEDFKKSPVKGAFHELSASSILHEAIKTALLQMQLGLPMPTDETSATFNCLRMEGAKQFVGILLNLTEDPQPRPLDKTQNLNHKI